MEQLKTNKKEGIIMTDLNMKELFVIAEELEQILGTKTFLLDLLYQMNKTELKEALEYIDRARDTNLFI